MPDLSWKYATAKVSDDGAYRYELARWWDSSTPSLEWIMLNPSTADAETDDPTIRRCIAFAKGWGFGGIVVHNLYALRATDPKVLATHYDPFGPENGDYLASTQVGVPMAAWGAHPMAALWWKRPDWRHPLAFRAMHCLGMTASGAPRHPLYVKSSQERMAWPSC